MAARPRGRAAVCIRYGTMARVARSTFGTAINCIDGRVQVPVITWMCDVLSLDYVDMITEPGADGFLARQPAVAKQLIQPKVMLSLRRHASPVLAIAAHHDCLANPGDEGEHRLQLLESVRLLRTWNLGVKILALWVAEGWRVDVVQTRGVPG
jgi:hypothetical protein